MGTADRMPQRHLERVESRPNPRTALPEWLTDIPAVRQVLQDGWDVPAGVTVLIGENGAGKSTLVEALAQRYPRLGNDRVGPVDAGDVSPLGSHLMLQCAPMASRAGFFLRAETMHDYLGHRDRAAGRTEPAWSHTPLLARSHGEGFLWVFEEAFWQPGMYFLDEPEAALSFSSTLALVSLLARMPHEGSQVVVATHSPLIAATPDATVIEVGDQGLVETSWQETDLVRNWTSFLESPERYLRHLR